METMNADAVRRLLHHLNKAVDALSNREPSAYQIGIALSSIEIARENFLAYAIAPVRIEPVAPALDVAA